MSNGTEMQREREKKREGSILDVYFFSDSRSPFACKNRSPGYKSIGRQIPVPRTLRYGVTCVVLQDCGGRPDQSISFGLPEKTNNNGKKNTHHSYPPPRSARYFYSVICPPPFRIPKLYTIPTHYYTRPRRLR